MKRLIEGIRTVNLRSKSFGDGYLKSLLLWNPLICFFVCLCLGGLADFYQRLIVCFLISTIVMHFCFAAVALARFVVTNFTKLKKDNPLLKSKGWSFSASFLAMPLGLYLAFRVVGFISPIFGLHGAPADANDYRFGLFIGTLIAGIYFLLETKAEAKDARRSAELRIKEIENERLQAQIAALTAQMNPHLLFNSLNTVASLVPTDPKKAEEVIVKLSELYRGVLDSSRNMTHSLSTELGLCEAYLAIEKVRFGERLTSEFNIAHDLNAAGTHVPALSLQPLIENAVKHGLAPLSAGGTVWISAKNLDGFLQILVEDNGVGIGAAKKKSGGAGSGIKNCHDRLKLHFGEHGLFAVNERKNGGTVVSIAMPIKNGFAQ